MPLALTNALWEVAYAYHAEAEEDLTDSGRVVSKPEVIQMAPRGSVTISRPADINFYASSSRRRIRLQADVIIDRIVRTLLAPEVSLRRLN